jgi:hypothetical protein
MEMLREIILRTSVRIYSIWYEMLTQNFLVLEQKFAAICTVTVGD